MKRRFQKWLACVMSAACFACAACVAVEDDLTDSRTPPPTATGGSGGMLSVTGGHGGGQGGATGGSGGVAGTAIPDAGEEPGPPPPDVNAIFESGCATATEKAELPAVNLLFVLDRSASMLCNPPPTTDSTACEDVPSRANPDLPSKWEITKDALTDTIRALPPQTVVGISYFSNGDACGVHSRPRVALATLAPSQVAAVEASLNNITPSGATPLVGATILAYRHLHDAALAGRLRGERFVVLLTDGEQSEACVDTERCDSAQSCTDLLVDEEVAKASGPGVEIRTFVIGAPGSENARVVLSRIAERGGTATPGCDADAGTCHFDMTEETDLASGLGAALAQIVGRALRCELPLPHGTDVVDRDSVNVVYSSSLGVQPTVIPRDDEPGCDSGANGWQYAADGKSIQLCGAACDDARQDPVGRMDVVLGCPVQGPE